MNPPEPVGTPADGPVRLEIEEHGALWRVTLATPKANIIDSEKISRLSSIFEAARSAAGLKAIVLEGEGHHFSFGASVEEHLPGAFERMIPAFGGMFRQMFDCSVVTLAAIRGQCLGGGLELACVCHRLFAAPDARLGQPEIVLGVFAPIASVLLAGRVGRGPAEDLCLSGRTISAAEALRIGLVDEVVEDPGAAALAYAREHLLPRSASSLRLAARAVRGPFARAFEDDLARAERLYLTELMATHDAREGLTAFLEKRQPIWRNA